MTERSDEDDFAAVIAAEKTLLEPKVRRDPEAVRAWLHEDFREFGQSGKIFDRRSIVAATAETDETAAPITAEHPSPTRLGPDTVLLTYVARWHGHASLRTSVWVRGPRRWLLLHHQGTPSGL